MEKSEKKMKTSQHKSSFVLMNIEYTKTYYFFRCVKLTVTFNKRNIVFFIK